LKVPGIKLFKHKIINIDKLAGIVHKNWIWNTREVIFMDKKSCIKNFENQNRISTRKNATDITSFETSILTYRRNK